MPPGMQLASANPIAAGTPIKGIRYFGALEAAVVEKVFGFVETEILALVGQGGPEGRLTEADAA
jgi:hypothetical protein